jgi:predicted DNA-binding ribbon-helix-helix protein
MNQESLPQPGIQSGRVISSILQPSSGLLSRNVRIHNRRTSVRLEPKMWEALKEIARAEGCSIHDLCGAVHDMKEVEASFTASLRVFLMEYYRAAVRTGDTALQMRRHLLAQHAALAR